MAPRDDSKGFIPIPRKTRLKTITESSGFALKSARSTATFSVSEAASRAAASDTTFNTLSMISTPWSTESWNSLTESLSDYTQQSDSTSFTSWTATKDSLSAPSVDPRSTSTTGVRTRTLASLSRTTVTIYSFASTPCPSHPIFVASRKSQSEVDTLSSWTVETYTSTGMASTKDRARPVKPKYPWSPATVASGSDYYPSSVDTLASRKGSRVSMASKPSSAKMINYPINYMTCNTKLDDHPALDWCLAKQNGIPVICSAI